jgi:hypothetical protein
MRLRRIEDTDVILESAQSWQCGMQERAVRVHLLFQRWAAIHVTVSQQGIHSIHGFSRLRTIHSPTLTVCATVWSTRRFNWLTEQRTDRDGAWPISGLRSLASAH